jgi:release factor glutamine methyltransferase
MNPLDPTLWNANLEHILKGHEHFQTFQNQHGDYSFCDLKLKCPPSIYKPTVYSTTFLTIKAAWNWESYYQPKTILEIGAGSGALGLALKTPDNHITLTDISPFAVEVIAENARMNNLNVEVLLSDMFQGVAGRRFDLVIFNVPFLDKPILNPADLALCDPGGTLARRFLDELPDYLTPGGAGLFAYSNVGHYETLRQGLNRYDYQVEQADYSGYLRWYRWVFSLRVPKTQAS